MMSSDASLRTPRTSSADDLAPALTKRKSRLHKNSSAVKAEPGTSSKRRKVEKQLFLSMDYGTKTLAMAYRIADGRQDPLATDVRDINFSGRDAYAPQEAAWNDAGEFFWGYDVEKQVAENGLKHESVIKLWKLLLYKKVATEPVAQRIQRQLGTRTLQELLTTHVRHVVEKAKEYIKEQQCHEYTPQEIDDLPMKLFLSVPQMWKVPANGQMVRAAKAAGVEYVELVWEPQCAAAYYTHQMKDRMPAQLRPGDVLQVADLGGGTGDFVSYIIRTGSRTDAQVSLKTFRQSEGSLCGSEWVNQNFLEWFKREHNLDEFAAQLGLDRSQCEGEMWKNFDLIKERFFGPSSSKHFVHVIGTQDAKEQSKAIALTSENMEAFFQPVVEEIMERIESQRTENTKVLFIPGGFGRSEYLLAKLRAKYKDLINIIGMSTDAAAAYQPISRGALLRYHDIKSRGMPYCDSFGIGRAEVYNPRRHRDAAYWPGDLLPTGTKCKRGPIMKTDIVDKDACDRRTFIVHERWETIVEQGEKLPGQPTTRALWQLYRLDPEDPIIKLRIYWTEAEIQDGDPICTGKDAFSPLREEIEQYDEDLETLFSSQWFEEHGFKPTMTFSNGEMYHLLCRLVVEREGANVKIRWQVAKPGSPPYHDDFEATEVELAMDRVFDLCDASHNPFVRQSVT